MLKGFGAGKHQVQLVVTAGAVEVVGAVIPSSMPPSILWQKEPRNPNRAAANEALLQDVYLPAATSVLVDFPTVIPITVDAGWDAPTMVSQTDGHPNDAGSLYFANNIERYLDDLSMRQGLNRLTAAASDAYVSPVPTVVDPNIITSDDSGTADGALVGRTTPYGGFAWTKSAGGSDGTIIGGVAQFTLSAPTVAAPDIWIDDAAATGWWETTLDTLPGVSPEGAGLIVRAAGVATNNTTGFAFWAVKNVGYRFRRRVSGDGYTDIYAGTTIPAVGDRLGIWIDPATPNHFMLYVGTTLVYQGDHT